MEWPATKVSQSLVRPGEGGLGHRICHPAVEWRTEGTRRAHHNAQLVGDRRNHNMESQIGGSLLDRLRSCCVVTRSHVGAMNTRRRSGRVASS